MMYANHILGRRTGLEPVSPRFLTRRSSAKLK